MESFKITNPVSCKSFSFFFRVLFPYGFYSFISLIIYNIFLLSPPDSSVWFSFICFILFGWLLLLSATVVPADSLSWWIASFHFLWWNHLLWQFILFVRTPCSLSCKIFLQKSFAFVPARSSPQERVKFRLCTCSMSQVWWVNFS